MRGDYAFQPLADTVTCAVTAASAAYNIPGTGNSVLVDNTLGAAPVLLKFGIDNTVDVTTTFRGTVGTGKREVFYVGPKKLWVAMKGPVANVYVTRGDGRL